MEIVKIGYQRLPLALELRLGGCFPSRLSRIHLRHGLLHFSLDALDLLIEADQRAQVLLVREQARIMGTAFR